MFLLFGGCHICYVTNLSVQATSDNDHPEEADVSVSEFNTRAVRDVKYKPAPTRVFPSTRKYTLLI